MDPSSLSRFREAGRIASKARDLGAAKIRPGVTIREVTEAVEAEIRRLGGEPAFPAQSSRNHIAAHYCASPDDATAYEEGDVVKLDIGAHVDGFVADTALTVDLSRGKNAKLVEAAKAALDAAIARAGAGVPVSEIGRVVDDTIHSFGYNPIVNLTGHGVGRYVIHCAPQIPNFPDKTTERLRAGMFVAIEPFATDGKGMIHEQGRPEVFRLLRRPAKLKGVDPNVLAAIEAIHGLPFARRDLRKFPKEIVEETFMALTRTGALVRYPPLCEAPGTKVAQWEHTLYIGETEVEVITR
jgi:methionyl aminopeptidase